MTDNGTPIPFRYYRIIAQVGDPIEPLVQRHPIQVKDGAVIGAVVAHRGFVIKLLDPGCRVAGIAEACYSGQEVEEAAHPVGHSQNQDSKLEGGNVADVDVHHELPGSEELMQLADPAQCKPASDAGSR